MDPRELKAAFMRNVGLATGGMGNPGAFDGPLPQYFGDKASTEMNKGMAGLSASLGLGALAIPAPEAAPVLLPAAGLGAMGAFGNFGEAERLNDASDMWKNTGLPQRPPRR